MSALGGETGMLGRLAIAPISWGVCEVPGWGLQLPPSRVLAEMAQLGFPATELGAEGWLSGDAGEIRDQLADHDLGLIGGFVPLVFHDPAHRESTLEHTTRAARLLADAGGEMFVSCPIPDPEWGPRQPLDHAGWEHLAVMVPQVEAIILEHGLTQAFHPHWDTVVQDAAEIDRVLATTDVRLCLDTGHLAVGGCDPLAFAADHADRVALVHLKDIDLAVARRLQAGELTTLMHAVQEGLFPPIGRGDLAIDEVVITLERSGYDGWYVLEQDAALTAGEPPEGSGPINGVRESVEHLRSVAGRIATQTVA